MIKNIIFDVDGTLINTTHVNMQGLQHILEDEGIYKSIEELTHFDGLPSDVTLRQLNIKDIKRLQNLWHDYVRNNVDDFSIYYAIPTVLKLISKTYNLSLVTSRNMEEINYDNKLKHLMTYFQGVICYEDTAKHKPDPAPLLKAMERFDYKSDETIYIGDSKYDYQSASDSGITFYKASWGNKDFKVDHPHKILKTPIDLLMYLN